MTAKALGRHLIVLSTLAAALYPARAHAQCGFADRTPTGGAFFRGAECHDTKKPCASAAECHPGDTCSAGRCITTGLPCPHGSECGTTDRCRAKFDLTVNLKLPGSATDPVVRNGWTPTTTERTDLDLKFNEASRALSLVTGHKVGLGTITYALGNSKPDAIVQLTRCPGGSCPMVAKAQTGGWGAAGAIEINTRCLEDPLCFAHEFLHLVGDLRDEYEMATSAQCDAPALVTDGSCRAATAGSACVMSWQSVAGGPTVAADICSSADHEMHGRSSGGQPLRTEQQRCHGHDCWTHLSTRWPCHIPATHPGPVAADSHQISFRDRNLAPQLVILFDRSGSMSATMPGMAGSTRLSYAVDRTKELLDELNASTEVALVSFAALASGNTNLDQGFTTDRGLLKNKLDDLRASGSTPIGAGLRRAAGLFAPGTFNERSRILLITDGENNVPAPATAAEADLRAALTELRDQRIAVASFCMAEAPLSQCALISSFTGGALAQDFTGARLGDFFADLVAGLEGSGIAPGPVATPIAQGDVIAVAPVLIEPNALQVRFLLSWQRPDTQLAFELRDPDGTLVDASAPGASAINGLQLAGLRVVQPRAGDWRMTVRGVNVAADERFSARALIDTRQVSVAGGLAKSVVHWPEPFTVSVAPAFAGPLQGCNVALVVERPDGTSDSVTLRDDGERGDGARGDGLHQLSYLNFTPGSGKYDFTAKVTCTAGQASGIPSEFSGLLDEGLPPGMSFERVLRFSGIANGVPADLPPQAAICKAPGLPPLATVECTAPATPVMLDGTCSTDREGALSYAWSGPAGVSFANPAAAQPTATFPVGEHKVALAVTDTAGQSSAATSAFVTVVDTTAPVFTFVPGPVTVATCDRPNIGTATATDRCGPVTVSNNAPARFPLGATTVTWTARDARGHAITRTQVVTAVLGDDPSCCPAGTNVMLGTSGADVRTGTAGRDCILLRGGNDTVDARGGDDLISGGAGDDTITGGDGNDTVLGGPGRDTITGGAGDDRITGGDGTDTCDGGTGRNTVLTCEITR